MADVSKTAQRGELEQRSVTFTVRVLRLAKTLNATPEGRIIAHQLLRSPSSVGANYRESGRASSKKLFISILEIAQREAAETAYRLEVIEMAGLVSESAIQSLRQESEELLSIITATVRTAKKATTP